MTNKQMALILQLIAKIAEKCETAEDAKELARMIEELSKIVIDAKQE